MKVGHQQFPTEAPSVAWKMGVRMRVRRWVESNGAAHEHVAVSMSLAVLVEFGVEIGQVRGKGNGNGRYIANA
jgi:hypothetical protein